MEGRSTVNILHIASRTFCILHLGQFIRPLVEAGNISTFPPLPLGLAYFGHPSNLLLVNIISNTGDDDGDGEEQRRVVLFQWRRWLCSVSPLRPQVTLLLTQPLIFTKYFSENAENISSSGKRHKSTTSNYSQEDKRSLRGVIFFYIKQCVIIKNTLNYSRT